MPDLYIEGVAGRRRRTDSYPKHVDQARSSTAFIASRRMSSVRAPLTRTGFHPLGTKYAGNKTVKTGRRLSSVTFTVHRRRSGAQSAKVHHLASVRLEGYPKVGQV
jgi:hypothetical protein